MLLPFIKNKPFILVLTENNLSHPYFHPGYCTGWMTIKGNNTVVTLVAVRWFHVVFSQFDRWLLKKRALFSVTFYFPLQGTDSYHARVQLSLATLKIPSHNWKIGRAGGFTLVLVNLTGSFCRKRPLSVVPSYNQIGWLLALLMPLVMVWYTYKTIDTCLWLNI